jgi:hypothetical protein
MPTRTKTRSCTGKTGRFPSRETAAAAMRAFIRNTGTYAGAMHVYPCDFGSHYHFGHRGRGRR